MKKTPVHIEFVALMALIMSIGALASDTLLPALGIIGDTFHVQTTAEKQLLITMTFLGIGVGQLFSGALSDSFGRKPIMYLGFIIFILASLLSVMTTHYEILVLSRVLQGLGLSAPRTLSTAIVRDSYSGNEMAKIMSFVAMTFIIVPAIAPTFGVFLLNLSGWQAIFYMQAIVASIAMLWFALRQVETLPADKRTTLNIHSFIDSHKEFFKQKAAVIYTLASGFCMGAFMTFLSTSESILIGQYHKVAEFPYLFGSIALAMGLSMFFNGKYVVRHGMKKMVDIAAIFFTGIPLAYILLFSAYGNPNVLVFIAFLMIQVFSIGFIFGNLTALTMEPLGHIAGMASAITGFVSSIIGVIYASIIGSFIETTALPLFIAFFLSGLLLLLFLRIAAQFEKH